MKASNMTGSAESGRREGVLVLTQNLPVCYQKTLDWKFCSKNNIFLYMESTTTYCPVLRPWKI